MVWLLPYSTYNTVYQKKKYRQNVVLFLQDMEEDLTDQEWRVYSQECNFHQGELMR